MTYVNWHNDTSPNIVLERTIAGTLIRNLLDAGYALGINNGGDEDEVRCSINEVRLFDNLSQSDHDQLMVYTREGKKVTDYVGFVLLVYGNDPEELIADYTHSLHATIFPAMEIEAAPITSFEN